MTPLSTSPALLMVGVLSLFVGGVVLTTWGRNLRRHADWLVGLGLLVLVVILGMAWSTLSDTGFAAQSWLRGWIWPREDAAAITVGVLRDSLGLSMATLTALVSAAVWVGSWQGSRQEARQRHFHSALCFSLSGVALSWFSLTPWISLVGTGLTILGGFLALGSRWIVAKEAALATRFGWERTWGLILAVLGLCVLAGGRAPLSLADATSSLAWSAQSSSSLTDLLGAGLLFAGALIQMQPFPFLGWVMSASETPCPSRIALAQVFPAWAAFAILIRLEPRFHDVGVFPAFGWAALVSALLASVAGIFKTEWRLSLSAWTSAAFSLSVAVLAFAGPYPAICLLVGAGLAAIALAGFGSAIEEGGHASGANQKRGSWAKVGCGLAAAAGTGMVGFVSAGGSLRWLTFVLSQPALAALSIVVLFLFMFLGWKVAWAAISLKGSTQASWASVLAPYLLVVLSLGVVWTGMLSGGVIPGAPDRLFHSLLSLIFAPGGSVGSGLEHWGDEAAFGTASAIYWASLALAMGAAYWTAGKKAEFWPGISRSLPKFSAFVTSGYGVDTLVSRALELISKLGEVSVWLVDHGTWQKWVPGVLAQALERGAALVAQADAALARWISGTLRKWVEVPAKALQLIQNGDVQWYLFFAVGSGIAILARFMRP